jgi:hypothetical protein
MFAALMIGHHFSMSAFCMGANGPDGLRQAPHGQLKLDRSVPASAPMIA